MPIQSAFTSQALAEAPVARSRAGQAEQQESGEVFALPDAEAPATAKGKGDAAGKIAVSRDGVAVEEANAAEGVTDPAKVQAQANAAQPTGVPGNTAAGSGKPTPQAAKADATGIAFLIAMAAAQADTLAQAAGKNAATEAEEVASGDGESETKKEGKAATEDKGEAKVAVPAPQQQAVATPVTSAVLPALLLQGASIAVEGAAGEGPEAISADGGAKKNPAKPGLTAATAGLPLVTLSTPEQPLAGAAVAADGKTAAGGVHTTGQGAPEFADILAKADQPAAANGAPAPAEAKAPDALQQQPATPFDLSNLLQVSGKPGHDRLVQPLDPNAAAAPGVPGQGTASSPPTPIHVVPIEIGLRAMSGSRQFDIRLDPDELGRVDVSLSISDKGEVSARLVVDRVETLHLLQRDARTLERAFEQAGLKPSDAGVDITLRDPSDQSAFRQNRQQDEAPQRSRQPDGIELAEDAPLSVDPAPQRRLIRLGGVDLSI